jgi:phage baseplate assembly protein W
MASIKKLFKGFSSEGKLGKRDWTLYDLELVKRDLMNNFMTRKGERVMMPTFGTIIWDMLFEPLTEANHDAIVDDVRRVIGNEPRVELLECNVSDFAHGIRIDCKLRYKPWEVVQSFSVDFDRRAQER